MGFFSFLKYTFIIFAAHRSRITALERNVEGRVAEKTQR
jgi:hypothetical protein